MIRSTSPTRGPPTAASTEPPARESPKAARGSRRKARGTLAAPALITVFTACAMRPRSTELSSLTMRTRQTQSTSSEPASRMKPTARTGLLPPAPSARCSYLPPHICPHLDDEGSCQEIGAQGYLIPAFLRLRSTRPIASRVGLGTWSPAREFGMDFKKWKTQAQS